MPSYEFYHIMKDGKSIGRIYAAFVLLELDVHERRKAKINLV